MDGNSGQFVLLAEKTGLTVKQIAGLLDKGERTIYRWMEGQTRIPELYVEAVREIIRANRPPKDSGESRFTFIDLFSGIGGMRMGFESLGGRCVFSCERDKFSRETYLNNFASHDDYHFPEDINEISLDSIGPHDVLLAGFPCQPFSIAGVSKKLSLGQPHGFRCESQGTLFFRIAEILEKYAPPAFLLENVKNLENHDGGKTFKVILGTLEADLGYKVSTRVINAKGWVPQNRERIFIAGFRKDTGFSFDDLEIPSPMDGPRLDSILHSEDGTDPPEEPYTFGKSGKVNPKYTLSRHLWTYLKEYADKHRKKGNGFGFGLFGRQDVARTLSARYYKDGSEILIKRKKGLPRRLTPRECARLMGFDGATRRFRIPVSDTQAYRQFGNAVVVPVVRTVALHMLPHILEVIERSRPKQLDLPIQVVSSESQIPAVRYD